MAQLSLPFLLHVLFLTYNLIRFVAFEKGMAIGRGKGRLRKEPTTASQPTTVDVGSQPFGATSIFGSQPTNAGVVIENQTESTTNQGTRSRSG